MLNRENKFAALDLIDTKETPKRAPLKPYDHLLGCFCVPIAFILLCLAGRCLTDSR